MAYQPGVNIQGWMMQNELNWLYARAQEMGSVVEIGAWKGRSTHALLSGCKGPVFAVDHFKGNSDQITTHHKEATTRDIFVDFWQNVGHFRNLVVMRMESVEAARFFAPNSVDMVFIDGCHLPEAVRADIEAWRPVCRKLLCGHDYSSIKEVLNDMKISAICNPSEGTIWTAVL